MESGSKGWVALLPRIAKIINSSTNRSLPRSVTPNEVWFNRATATWPEISQKSQKKLDRRARSVNGAQDQELPSDDDDDDEESQDNSADDNKAEDVHEATVQSLLHQHVKADQANYNNQMIKRKGGVIIKYRKGQVVLLKIPKKE